MYGFLQVLGLICFFQVFKCGKPLLSARMCQVTIICGSYTMYTPVFLQWQQCVSKVTHLCMNIIETSIELYKRGLHELITCTTPVLLKFCRKDGPCSSQELPSFLRAYTSQSMLVFRTYYRARRRRSFRLDEQDNLFV